MSNTRQMHYLVPPPRRKFSITFNLLFTSKPRRSVEYYFFLVFFSTAGLRCSRPTAFIPCSFGTTATEEHLINHKKMKILEQARSQGDGVTGGPGCPPNKVLR